jgi:hypothetical protein
MGEREINGATAEKMITDCLNILNNKVKSILG